MSPDSSFGQYDDEPGGQHEHKASFEVANILVIDGLGVNNRASVAQMRLFQIVGSVLYLKSGVLDYQPIPVLNVTVAVDDAAVGSTPDSSGWRSA
jgi:hypothetical protein